MKGKSWRDVQRVFKTAADDPELALIELGKLIGLDQQSLYPDQLDVSGPASIRLRFKAPPAPRRRVLQGPPRVGVPDSAERDLTMKLSAGAQSFGWMVRSEGGGANGVEITIGGTAIESALLAIDSVEYRNGAGTLEKPTESGVLVAEFPTAGFPAASGVVHGAETVPEVADNQPIVAVNLRVAPLRLGEATLELRVAPTEPAGPPWLQRWKFVVL